MIMPTRFDLVVTPMGLRFQNRMFACTKGRGGIIAPELKREGDGATPRGLHHIVGMLYRPDRISAPSPWAEPIGLNDRWSDASGQEDYNQLVQRPYPHSHETLRRADPLYDLVLVTDWNYPQAEAGRGSAIFMHQWRRPCAPTAGCIGLAREDLHWIAPRISYGTRLIVL